jgi:hypothetical protein
VSNYNSHAPTVGIHVVNGSPEHSVVSATLSLASTFSPTEMLGHAMPLLPHSRIGSEPFADQGCRFFFDKATVTIFHPNSHTILEGWHELDGPQLWKFLFTGLPRPPAASPPPPPNLPPLPLDPGSRVPAVPKNNILNIKSNILNITKLTDQDSCASHINVQPFPCQGINATNNAGEDISVYYLHEVAQAMVRAA